MSHETIQPTRAEWTRFSDDVQRDVNETLTTLQWEIEATNSILADISREDPEAAAQKASEATEYLDGMWGYMGDIFMITGKWQVPSHATVTRNGISFRNEKREAFNFAHSAGFTAMNVSDNDTPVFRIGLSFALNQQTISTPTFHADVQLLAFAEPHEVSLQFVRPASPEVVSSSLDEVTRTISTSEALLQMYINHADTSFFRQNAKRQSAFLRELVDTVDSVLPAPESMDKLELINAVSQDVYFKSPTEEKISQCITDPPGQKYHITGDVLGVTLLDIIENGYDKTYQSPGEMMASETGLCLIVRPTSTNIDLKDFGTPDLIVPLQSLESHALRLV